MTPARQMSLGLLPEGTGVHPASWLDPSTPANAAVNIRHYVDIARTAERGKIDFIFIADTPAARTSNLQCWSRFPLFMNVLEPVSLLSALALQTTHLGLGGTATTSFNEPYNVARLFASLDHISGGRAAWNVVTSANEYVALNFGLEELPPHTQRYERAREFLAVVEGLWDSYEDDAFVYDRRTGYYFDPAKLHVLDHHGPHFKVHGALNIGRTPQGRPVVIQAGASSAGRELAAETADVVFGADESLELAQGFYRDLKGRMAKYGRTPDQLRVLPALRVVLGGSAQEAEDKYQTLQSLIHPDVALQFLAGDLEADLSGLDWDKPIPEERIPASANLHKNFFDKIVTRIRTERPTLRQLCMSYERGNRTIKGTPMQVADMMEEWFGNGAADGFMLLFLTLPSGLDDFVAGVVPELQRRGLFRQDYAGATLRENLGLGWPVNRHAAQPAPKRVAVG